MSLPAGTVEHSGLQARRQSRAARDALLSLWAALEAMQHDDARVFLEQTGAPFLPGLDRGQVLDALARDRARRVARGGDA